MLGQLARGAILAVGLLTTLVACGGTLLPTDRTLPDPAPVADPVVDCLAVPTERCAQALADAIAAAEPGIVPTRIRVTCSTPACTLVAGQAQVDAMLSDGTVRSWAQEWSHALEVPPPGLPEDATILPITPACVGLDLERCREMAKSIIVPVGQTGRVVGIVVACTVATCDATEGQGTTTVTFEDGTTRVADWGYAGG
jgi:hypothetical protein